MTVQTDIDAEFAAYYTSLKTKQDTYAGANSGRYFQGLHTHSVIPSDGVATAPDQLANKPSYQTEAWNHANFNFTPGATTKHSLKIDVNYNGTNYSWIASTWAYVGGALMYKSYTVDHEGTKTDGSWTQEEEIVNPGEPTTFTAYKIVPTNPTSEYLQVGAADDLSINSDSVTFGCWILNNTNDATIRYVIKNWDSSGDAVCRLFYQNGKLVAWVSKTGGNSAATTRSLTTTSNAISASWKFVAFVWDGTGATAAAALKIYVDGVNQAGTAAGTAALPYVYNSADLFSTEGFQIYYGFENGVQFGQWCRWNVALSAAELLELYNRGQSFDMQTNYGNYLRKNNVIQRYGFTSADGLDTTIGDTGLERQYDLAGSLDLKNYPSSTWGSDEIEAV